MMGKEMSYAPGPSYSIGYILFFFLFLGDTEPNGAYD